MTTSLSAIARSRSRPKAVAPASCLACLRSLATHSQPPPPRFIPALILPHLRAGKFLVAARPYSTAPNGELKQEKALMDELRRLTQRQGADGPTLGPFMMPRGAASEHPLRKEEHLHWSRVSWTERGRRTLRLSRNVFVVSLGGCIGLLVVYSITSELFAPSSTTNLMGSTIESLQESEGLRKILRGPYKFHSLSPHASTSKQHSTGPIELRFFIEGCVDHSAELDWRSADWWKSWIGPLITSEVYHPPSLESPPEPHSSGEQSDRWWPGIVKTLMPMTLSKSSGAGDRRGWSDRMLPTPGSFERGEVTAELIKVAPLSELSPSSPTPLIYLDYFINLQHHLKKLSGHPQRIRPDNGHSSLYMSIFRTLKTTGTD